MGSFNEFGDENSQRDQDIEAQETLPAPSKDSN